MRTIIIIAIILLIIFGGIGIFYAKYIVNESVENTVNEGAQEIDKISACIGFDCPAGTKYVGSINSDKYYECRCRWAKNLLPENIKCFKDDNEALADNRTKSECWILIIIQ